ncbi:TPA: pilin [Vibrio diabolicus]
MKNSKQKKQQGFTLIELMIVVAVIGILSAIAIPAYQNYVKKTEAATGLSTARSLLTNVDMYIQEEGTFPSTLKDVGASDHMNPIGTLAVNPDASAATGTITFTYDQNLSSIENAEFTITKATTGWSCAFANNGATISTDELPKTCRP